MVNNVTLQDFWPVNRWRELPPPEGRHHSLLVEDLSTGRTYWDSLTGRFDCFQILLQSVLFSPIASIVHVAVRIAKIVTLSHFWIPQDESSSRFSARLWDSCKDCIRVVAQPLVLIALPVAAIYGILFRPRDGVKLCASIERAQYGGPLFIDGHPHRREEVMVVDQRLAESNDVTLRDFSPFNRWSEGCLRGEEGCRPRFWIDHSTDRLYRHQTIAHIRLTSLLMIPMSYYISLIRVAIRIIKLVTLSHFWLHKQDESSSQFTARLREAGKDLLRIATEPLAFVARVLAAGYGVFYPLDGMKLLVSIERIHQGHSVVDVHAIDLIASGVFSLYTALQPYLDPTRSLASGLKSLNDHKVCWFESHYQVNG